jgi:hypothetical protein
VTKIGPKGERFLTLEILLSSRNPKFLTQINRIEKNVAGGEKFSKSGLKGGA